MMYSYDGYLLSRQLWLLQLSLSNPYICPLLRKETDFKARQVLTNQRGNKILSCFGNEKEGSGNAHKYKK